MKKNIYSPKPVRVPVKLVDGQWEYFYGGGLPIRNGTVGDLVVDRSSIEDEQFLESLKRKSAHKILGVGTELLVALTIKPAPKLDSKLNKHLISMNDSKITLGSSYYFTQRSPDTQFVKIWIAGPTKKQKEGDPTENGGVWLHLVGMQPKGITTSTVKIPDVASTEVADSLNYAFTLLSEKYEPWRKSHTGNIYDRILYQEKNQMWYPLDVLRNAAIAEDEHQLIRDQWADISKSLNLQNNTNR